MRTTSPPRSAPSAGSWTPRSCTTHFDYCSELVSLIARRPPPCCAERTSDPVVLNTVSEIETLGAQMSQKIWQKISLLRQH